MAEPSLQAIVDRLAIEDLLTKYSWSIDTKQFDGLDDVFTADAHIDYTSSGGVKGPFPEVKAWLSKVLPSFPAYQHLVTNKQVVIDGDAATCRAEFYNPMIMAGEGRRDEHLLRRWGVPRQDGAHRRGVAHRRAHRGLDLDRRRRAVRAARG